MFFLAISMVGTDFSMICQLFPHRARSEIKVSGDDDDGCTASNDEYDDEDSYV